MCYFGRRGFCCWFGTPRKLKLKNRSIILVSGSRYTTLAYERDHLVCKAQSVNKERKAIALSSDENESATLASSAILEALNQQYQNKTATHLFDFSLLNGTLSRHLIKDRWPKVSALEPFHVGNILNAFFSTSAVGVTPTLNVPPNIDFSVHIDDVFAFQSQNSGLIGAALKKFDSSSHLASGTRDVFGDFCRPFSESFRSLRLHDGRSSCKFVAVGCFADTQNTQLRLKQYAHFLLNRVLIENNQMNRMEILAFFPDRVANVILDEKFGKNSFKMPLEFSCSVEPLGFHAIDGFECSYKPKEPLPAGMQLLHIKPRYNYEKEIYLGISPDEQLQLLLAFFTQLSFSPCRSIANCLEFWTLPHLRNLLSESQLNASLQSLTLNQFVELFLQLSCHQDFAMLTRAWLRMSAHQTKTPRVRKPQTVRNTPPKVTTRNYRVCLRDRLNLTNGLLQASV